MRADSYVTGFNNRLAIAGLLLTLLLGTLWAAARRGAEGRAGGVLLLPAAGEARLSRRLLAGTSGLYLLLHLVLIGLLAGRYFSDSEYFLRRLELVRRAGLAPYRDFEFAYGPLLLQPAAWLDALCEPLGLPLAGAYYLHFLLFSLVGLALLWRFTDRGCGPPAARRTVFLLAALATFETGLGLNYTLPRFLLPFLGLLFLDAVERRHPERPLGRQLAAYFWRDLALSALAFALSPEMGLAYSAAALVRIPVAAWSRRRSLLWLLLPWALARLSLVPLLPPGYAEVYRAFAGGGYDIPAYPAPHLLLYTAALLWVVPLLLRVGGRRDRTLAPPAASLATLAVCLIPGALGRSDPGHVLGYGLAPLIWALLLLAERHPRGFRLAAPAFALVFVVGAQGVTLFHHRGVLARAAWEAGGTRWLAEEDVRRFAAALALDPEKVDRALRPPRPPAGLRPLVAGHRQLVAPFPLPAEAAAIAGQTRLLPAYFVDNVNLLTPAQVERAVRGLRRERFLLAPAEVLRPGALAGDLERIRRALGQRLLFPVWYPRRRPPYWPEEELAKEIRAGWEVAAEADGFVLLRRQRAALEP